MAERGTRIIFIGQMLKERYLNDHRAARVARMKSGEILLPRPVKRGQNHFYADRPNEINASK